MMVHINAVGLNELNELAISLRVFICKI